MDDAHHDDGHKDEKHDGHNAADYNNFQGCQFQSDDHAGHNDMMCSFEAAGCDACLGHDNSSGAGHVLFSQCVEHHSADGMCGTGKYADKCASKGGKCCSCTRHHNKLRSSNAAVLTGMAAAGALLA